MGMIIMKEINQLWMEPDMGFISIQKSTLEKERWIPCSIHASKQPRINSKNKINKQAPRRMDYFSFMDFYWRRGHTSQRQAVYFSSPSSPRMPDADYTSCWDQTVFSWGVTLCLLVWSQGLRDTPNGLLLTVILALTKTNQLPSVKGVSPSTKRLFLSFDTRFYP